MTALNRFIHDVYHGQEILKAGIVPAEQVLNNAQFRPEMVGVDVPGDIYSHISGIDIVRAGNADGSGDLLRAGRQPARAQRRELHAREPQDDDAAVPGTVQRAPRRAGGALPRPAARDAARRGAGRRERARRSWCSRRACTTAPTSSTPSWRSRWAWSWSRGRTCSCATASSTCAPRRARKRVDVIYRRVDDDFLDPQGLPPRLHAGLRRPAGCLPGRQRHAVQRRSAPASPTTRASIPYVPKMIEFYLGEKPILNNVPTYLCREPNDLQVRAGPPGRTRGQGGARRRRLRHARRPGGDARRRSPTSAPWSRPTRPTTSRSRR